MANSLQIARRSCLNRTCLCAIFSVSVLAISGCDMQQRRVDIKQASGVDDSIDERFGLTPDAQDPSKRDAELGYGRWKQKPETEGTAAPTDPSRRGSNWTGSPSSR